MGLLKTYMRAMINGVPILVLSLVVALLVAQQVIRYTPTTYLTTAKLKLDTKKYGVSNDQLYEDFDVFTSENKTETEAEVLSSHLLIQQVLPKIYLNPQVQRVGKLKTTTLYKNSPFLVKSTHRNNLLDNVTISLEITENDLSLSYTIDETPHSVHFTWNDTLNLHGNTIELIKDEHTIDSLQITPNGKYAIQFFSEEALIGKLQDKLNVKALDKEMTILQVAFHDDIPERAADFNNLICETYMEDYVKVKTFAAEKTVQFIDEKLDEVGRDLEQAEIALEMYRLQNNVVNMRQATETGLRQVADLQVQLVNTQMQEEAIRELEAYLDSGNYFTETAIHVGFGDLLLTELVTRLKALRDEKKDLAVHFTEQSDEMQVVDAKIAEIEFYIEEAIRSNKAEIRVKREQLEKDLEIYTHQFDDVPIVERKLRVLERDFKLQESVYNFLSQKRIEAFIASTSQTSFHRIIQPAYVPRTPVSPNKTLIRFLFGFFGLIFGGVFIFIRNVSGGIIYEIATIENNSLIPALGTIDKLQPQRARDMQKLLNSFFLRDMLSVHDAVAFAAPNQKEKGQGSRELAQAASYLGYSTCIVRVTITSDSTVMVKETTEEFVPLIEFQIPEQGSVIAMKDVKQLIQQTKAKFDVVIIDCPPLDSGLISFEIFSWCRLGLIGLTAGVSKINTLSKLNMEVEDYQLQHAGIVLQEVDHRVWKNDKWKPYLSRLMRFWNTIKLRTK